MEIYLVKKTKVEFKGPGTWIGDKMVLRKSTPKHFKFQLTPVEEYWSGAKRFQEAFMKTLNEKVCDEFKSDLDDEQEISPNLSVSLALPFPAKLSSLGQVNLFHDKDGDCFILERLWEVFGPGHLNVSFNFTGSIQGVCKSEMCLEAKEMPIFFEPNPRTAGQYLCESTQLEVPEILASRWGNKEVLQGVLTVKLMFSHESLNELHMGVSGKNELIERNKSLLNEAVGSDVVIIPGNGARVKCHKSFLMGKFKADADGHVIHSRCISYFSVSFCTICSDVFSRMFESDMRETLTNSLNMPDISEAGVRAFLAFIYHSDISAASGSCDIALELLQAAEKYGISSLDSAMKDLICSMPKEWVGVDMAIRMLIYGKNLSEQNGVKSLMRKAVQVIQWYSKKYESKLFESAEFRQWHGNMQASMELTALLLKFTDSD